MMLWLIGLPLLGGLLAGLAGDRGARAIALATMVAGLVATLLLWFGGERELVLPWIPALGANLHLVLDGLSLPLVLLTWALGLVAIGASGDVHERAGFYHLNLVWVLAGVIGVFLAADLLLFFVFWELMLVPMYLVIGIWGHEHRLRAALTFFVFTQASGLLMLVSIVGLFLVHLATTGVASFDLAAVASVPIPPALEPWLLLGFFLAFAVKIPAVPLHTWLPLAHTEAPTGGSVVLAGLLLKTGGYGLIRFLVPLFPDASARFAPAFMALGVVGVIYGAWLAFAQTDAKRLVAYSSVSHMGFVLLAVFAWNGVALQGALLQMICHGLSTGGLFVIVGMLQQRLGTRDLGELGGLMAEAPGLAGAGTALAIATLALPGSGNFVAEFLCLLGAFRVEPVIAAVGAVGPVVAAVYALWFVQQVFQGAPRGRAVPDLRLGEGLIQGGLLAGLLWLGLYPQPLFDLAAEVFPAPAQAPLTQLGSEP